MSTHDLMNSEGNGFVSRRPSEDRHPWRNILLVVVGAFILGAIPITYGLTSARQDATPRTPGEAGLWTVVVE